MANMAIEAGAKNAIFPCDAKLVEYGAPNAPSIQSTPTLERAIASMNGM